MKSIIRKSLSNRKLFFLSIGLCIAISPVLKSCAHNNKIDNSQRQKPMLLNASQLSSIRDEFIFKLSDEAQKEYNAEQDNAMARFIQVIEKLNKKYNNSKHDDGDKIANDVEFKKYFFLHKPDITKVSKSHRIDIRFKVDNITRQIDLFYDVICFDLRVNEVVNAKIPMEID